MPGKVLRLRSRASGRSSYLPPTQRWKFVTASRSSKFSRSLDLPIWLSGSGAFALAYYKANEGMPSSSAHERNGEKLSVCAGQSPRSHHPSKHSGPTVSRRRGRRQRLHPDGVPILGLAGPGRYIQAGYTICMELHSGASPDTAADSSRFGQLYLWKQQLVTAAQHNLCPDTLR